MWADDSNTYMGSVSAHPLNLVSGNSTRASLDNTGRLIVPNQPMFSAYRDAGNYSQGASTAIALVYNGELFDIGNNFNTTTGVFTAPVAGRYEFSVYHQSNCTTSTNGYISINVNGSQYKLLELNANTLGSVAGTIIIPLAAGDSVSVGLSVITSTVLLYCGSSLYNFFTGKLIS